jgi:hypothetical protein
MEKLISLFCATAGAAQTAAEKRAPKTNLNIIPPNDFRLRLMRGSRHDTATAVPLRKSLKGEDLRVIASLD